MPPRTQSRPYNFKARGLYDALDGQLAPPGACYQLLNLIPDLTTPGLWQPRPAATLLDTAFGNITVMLQDGTNLYYMASSGGSGTDKPAGYDAAAAASIPATAPGGLPAGAYPTTQATTGAWTPPTMEIIGTRIIITHPGYNYAGGYAFGWLDISGVNVATTGDTAVGNPTITNVASTAGLDLGMIISGTNIPAGAYVIAFTATTITMSANATGTTAGGAVAYRGGGGGFLPLYGAGNTRTNALPSAPTCVKMLNNRAYYGCGDKVYYSDVLNPCTITNASQSLTLAHSLSTGSKITGMGQLPLSNQLGGIVGSLIVFKNGQDSFWQISGDAATSNLTLNGPVNSMPCTAPRTIVQTPVGLAFVGPDGVRIISFDGTLQTNPLGGVRAPFISAPTPSRLCAGYNSSFLIVAGYMTWNQVGSNSGFTAYYFDFKTGEWSGPHWSGAGDGLAWDAIVPLYDHFAVTSNSAAGQLFSQYTWTPASPSYTENGNTYTCRLQSAPFPEDDEMRMKQITAAAIDLGFVGALSPQSVVVTFNNETTLLESVTITGPTGGTKTLQTYTVNITAPIVYQKADVRAVFTASAGQRIGIIRLQTKVLGYKNVQPT